MFGKVSERVAQNPLGETVCFAFGVGIDVIPPQQLQRDGQANRAVAAQG